MSIRSYKKNFNLLQERLVSYDLILKYNIKGISLLPLITNFSVTIILDPSSKNILISNNLLFNLKQYFMLYCFFFNQPKICTYYKSTDKRGSSSIETCSFNFCLYGIKKIYPFLFDFLIENKTNPSFSLNSSTTYLKKKSYTALIPLSNLRGVSYLLSSSLITFDLKDVFCQIRFETTNSIFKNLYKNFPLLWNS